MTKGAKENMTKALEDIVQYFHLDATETTTHLDNVKALTARFLTAIPDLTSEYQQAVIHASMLHDIGKASVPKPILYKKGSLDENERFIIETHPITGMYLFSKILTKVNLLQTNEEHDVMKNVILYHHERWDGTGYPFGLKAQDIPLESRIISIVDVYDALTSKRSYKAAWSKEKALSYLVEESGNMFDPYLVSCFLEAIDETKETKETQKNHV